MPQNTQQWVAPLKEGEVLPVANSGGISHRGRHDEEGVGWYSILEAVDVAEEVGQVEAHPQQLLWPTYGKHNNAEPTDMPKLRHLSE